MPFFNIILKKALAVIFLHRSGTTAFHATVNDGPTIPFDSAVIFDEVFVNIGNG